MSLFIYCIITISDNRVLVLKLTCDRQINCYYLVFINSALTFRPFIIRNHGLSFSREREKDWQRESNVSVWGSFGANLISMPSLCSDLSRHQMQFTLIADRHSDNITWNRFDLDFRQISSRSSNGRVLLHLVKYNFMTLQGWHVKLLFLTLAILNITHAHTNTRTYGTQKLTHTNYSVMPPFN